MTYDPELEWYEQGYPGGHMVAVRGFPRPLYPPDAEGYAASVDGSDVEAYKRTVSRAGRWEWQAFDQAFSNGFSHGKAGGNVGVTGIEGVQRQQRLNDTGYVGMETFKTLRSIKIPEGLPHAGEYAMDARSVELINAAYDRFKGSEPTPEPPSGSFVVTAAKARLGQAITQLGIKESPPNSNRCKYCDWYGMLGPWCAMFVTWCDQNSGVPTASFKRGSRYAYVPYIVTDARLGANGLTVTSAPQPGDVVCFDWTRDGEYQHVGIVETAPTGTGAFTSIEGNTAVGNDSNGGEVMRRHRNRGSQGTVFVRVAE